MSLRSVPPPPDYGESIEIGYRVTNTGDESTLSVGKDCPCGDLKLLIVNRSTYHLASFAQPQHMTLAMGGHAIADSQRLSDVDVETGAVLWLSISDEAVGQHWAAVQAEARRKLAEQEAKKQAAACAEEDRQCKRFVRHIDNQDWCHLSAAQKAAAGTLGYTKHIWDRDQITDLSCEDQDWAELTEHQRDACQTLGYNQRVWDAS